MVQTIKALSLYGNFIYVCISWFDPFITGNIFTEHIVHGDDYAGQANRSQRLLEYDKPVLHLCWAPQRLHLHGAWDVFASVDYPYGCRWTSTNGPQVDLPASVGSVHRHRVQLVLLHNFRESIRSDYGTIGDRSQSRHDHWSRCCHRGSTELQLSVAAVEARETTFENNC